MCRTNQIFSLGIKTMKNSVNWQVCNGFDARERLEKSGRTMSKLKVWGNWEEFVLRGVGRCVQRGRRTLREKACGLRETNERTVLMPYNFSASDPVPVFSYNNLHCLELIWVFCCQEKLSESPVRPLLIWESVVLQIEFKNLPPWHVPHTLAPTLWTDSTLWTNNRCVKNPFLRLLALFFTSATKVGI